MKIAFVSDVHVANHRVFGGRTRSGINTRCSLILDSLRQAVKVASYNQCDKLVVLGDLFDSSGSEPSRPESQVIAAVREVLRDFEEEVVCLLGNHEMDSTESGDNSLSALSDTVTVVEETTMDEDGLGLIPHFPGDPNLWLPRELEKVRGCDVVGMHVGLSDAETPGYLSGFPVRKLQTLMTDLKIETAMAGDWHHPRRWQNVVQVGALVPTGFADRGPEFGQVCIVEDGRILQSRWIEGPRFFTVSTPEARGITPGCVYLKIVSSPEDHEQALSIRDELMASGSVRGAVVEVDGSGVRATARDAAKKAARSETLQGVIEEFVGAYPLPEGVERSKVLSLVREYLRI